MKENKYDEHTLSLRLKVDFKHVNPTLRDPIIYR